MTRGAHLSLVHPIENFLHDALEDTSYAQDEVPPRRDRRRCGWKREEILDRISRWATIYGEPPTKRDWNVSKLRSRLLILKQDCIRKTLAIQAWEAGDWPSETTVRKHFGSLNAALAELGLAPRPAGRPPKGEYIPSIDIPTGQKALEKTIEDIRTCRHERNLPDLKNTLYDLANIAIYEADKIKC